MKYLVIGDIHGEIDKIRKYEEYFNKVDMTILVGDYVDRGPDSIGVLKYVQTIPNSVRLTGNHEHKYLKKIRDGKIAYPKDVTETRFEEFKQALIDAVGSKRRTWYKDENLAVSHAPAALYQHDWNTIPFDKFIYAWTRGVDSHGFPMRIPLSEVYPGQTTQKPIIYGHIHSSHICIRPHEYCVDLDCGKGGPLAAVILENQDLVETIEV
jgi:protein phosphatase